MIQLCFLVSADNDFSAERIYAWAIVGITVFWITPVIINICNNLNYNDKDNMNAMALIMLLIIVLFPLLMALNSIFYTGGASNEQAIRQAFLTVLWYSVIVEIICYMNRKNKN